MIQILELFGGIGSPRCALRNIGIQVKAIDYVEIDEKAVRSYNAMFADELAYKTQSVVGWNLKPDILIHGIHIIEQMGEWKPKYVIWENVKNVTSRHMKANFKRYLSEMERLGYTSNYKLLDAREFGLPQARERVFTVSQLGNERFSFDDLIKTPMRDIKDFLLPDAPPVYDVTQPSVLNVIGKTGIKQKGSAGDYKVILMRILRQRQQYIKELGVIQCHFINRQETVYQYRFLKVCLERCF